MVCSAARSLAAATFSHILGLQVALTVAAERSDRSKFVHMDLADIDTTELNRCLIPALHISVPEFAARDDTYNLAWVRASSESPQQRVNSGATRSLSRAGCLSVEQVASERSGRCPSTHTSRRS